MLYAAQHRIERNEGIFFNLALNYQKFILCFFVAVFCFAAVAHYCIGLSSICDSLRHLYFVLRVPLLPDYTHGLLFFLIFNTKIEIFPTEIYLAGLIHHSSCQDPLDSFCSTPSPTSSCHLLIL